MLFPVLTSSDLLISCNKLLYANYCVMNIRTDT
uniref:Uncharacterized protein n=1 Tax=Arundo donax TaxID=35708 RepID=A0A0A9FDU7_ARUDO